jgi:hypothetical protein
MPTSRAVILLGMHRSGTSAIARGLAALGIHMGNEFLEAQPENPTGYWEDKGIVDINERVFNALGVRWDSTSAIDAGALAGRRLRALRREAIRYCARTFGNQTPWGFKDPRTMRVLPFWQSVFSALCAADAYVVAVRHPRSVAASLFVRQQMPEEAAYLLWLRYTVPFLSALLAKPMVVLDYDCMMREPQAQLLRIAKRLRLPSPDERELENFAGEFLDERLRHTAYEPTDALGDSPIARLTQQAYSQLFEAAVDRRSPYAAAFWRDWEILAAALPP